MTKGLNAYSTANSKLITMSLNNTDKMHISSSKYELNL